MLFPGDSQRRSTPTLEEALQLVLGRSQPSCSTVVTSSNSGVSHSAAGNSGVFQPTMSHSAIPTQFTWSPMFTSPGSSQNPSLYLTRQSTTPLNPTRQGAASKPTSAAPARARWGRGEEAELHNVSATSLVHSRGLFQQTLTNHQLTMNSQHQRALQEIREQVYESTFSNKCTDNDVSAVSSSRDQNVIRSGQVPAAELENVSAASTVDTDPVGNPSGIGSRDSSSGGSGGGVVENVRFQNGRISPDSIMSSDSLCAAVGAVDPRQTRLGVRGSPDVQNLKRRASPTVNSNQNDVAMVSLGQHQQLGFDRIGNLEAGMSSAVSSNHKNHKATAVSSNQENLEASGASGTTVNAVVDYVDRTHPGIGGIGNLGARLSPTVNTNAGDMRNLEAARTSPGLDCTVKNPEITTKSPATTVGSNPDTSSQPPTLNGTAGNAPSILNGVTSGGSFFLHRGNTSVTNPNVAVVQPSVQFSLPRSTTATTTNQHFDEHRTSDPSASTTTTAITTQDHSLNEHVTTQPSVVIPFPAVTEDHENVFSRTAENNEYPTGTGGRETQNTSRDRSNVVSGCTDNKGYPAGTLGETRQQSVVNFVSVPPSSTKIHAAPGFPNTMAVLPPEDDSNSLLPLKPPPAPETYPWTVGSEASRQETIFAVPPGYKATDFCRTAPLPEFPGHNLGFPRRSSDKCPRTLDFPAVAAAALCVPAADDDITYDEIPVDDTSSVSSVTSDIAVPAAAARSTTTVTTTADAAAAPPPKSILKKRPMSCTAVTTSAATRGQQFAAHSTTSHRAVHSTMHGTAACLHYLINADN